MVQPQFRLRSVYNGLLSFERVCSVGAYTHRHRIIARLLGEYMKSYFYGFRVVGYAALASAALLAGCTTTTSNTGPSMAESELASRRANLDAREAQLRAREAELEAAANAAAASPAPVMKMDDDLLPPDAEPGECYTRVWREPTYRTVSEEKLVADADERVEIIPARYETVTEQVLVSEASTRLETVPATYETITEQKLVKEASEMWRLDLGSNAAPASQSILDAASSHGIDLDGASPGQCFHEHYRPVQYEKVAEQVLVAEGYDVVEAADAEYRWTEKQVLVKEASTRLEHYDAVYETVTEQVVDVPAHTIWKKGTGPIQKIDAATGEIMCLVEVPATYKTISKKVLVTPAGTREVEIPAEYKTVRVRELVHDAEERRSTVDPQYDNVYVTKKVADASFVWHEVHDLSEPPTTRTGRKICLVAEPAQYETVKRRVVKTEAFTRTVEIPAEYETVTVTKLAEAAREVRTEIPAVYDTVTRRELDVEGAMEWRSILCETNMTVATISDIQRKLKSAGYYNGPVDGAIGPQTIEAVNRFQRDNNLPVDRYLNIETVKALEVSI